MSSTVQHGMPIWNQAVLSASIFENSNQKTHAKVCAGCGRKCMVDNEVVISNVHSSFVKSAVFFPENCWNCLAIMICISIGFKVYKHP